MDKVLAAIFSICGIVFTYWYFLGKKGEEVVAVNADSINITVEGGYNPETISINKGQPVTLNFFRKDPSSCLEEVVLPDFKIRKYLPLNEKTPITITAQKEGTYEIVCGMNMFHGKIIVQ